MAALLANALRKGRFLNILILVGLTSIAQGSFAGSAKTEPEAAIVIISNSTLSYHKAFTHAFIAQLKQNAPHQLVVTIDTAHEDVAVVLNNTRLQPRLIIPVGKSSATIITELRPSSPVLFALTSRDTHERLQPLANSTALYIDQPIERVLQLVSIALPQMRAIASILGPASQGLAGPIRSWAEAHAFEAHIHTIDDARQLNSTLYSAMGEGQVLVAFPDPLVINQQSAKNIILTAYLKRTPLVAYSESLVQAGALMAVYSSPEQLAVQAALLSMAILEDNSLIHHGPFYPSDFSIAVNYQVARALGLDIDAQKRLKEQLLQRLARP